MTITTEIKNNTYHNKVITLSRYFTCNGIEFVGETNWLGLPQYTGTTLGCPIWIVRSYPDDTWECTARLSGLEIKGIGRTPWHAAHKTTRILKRIMTTNRDKRVSQYNLIMLGQTSLPDHNPKRRGTYHTGD